MCQEFLYGSTVYGDVFRMHFVAFYFFTFHRFESTGSDVKGDFFQIHSFFFESVQYAFREMQTGSRGGYGPFIFE